MHALVIVAHPCEGSFCKALADAAVEGLQSGGHTTDLIDLYAEGFVAAMSIEERRRYDSDTPIVDPQVADHAARLERADVAVFVYPTWWSTVPAIMKGWIDRVLVNGVAFQFDANGRPHPRLRQMRRIIGISTYGSPRLAVALANDNGRRLLTRAVRLTCGLRTRTTWLGLYAMDATTETHRNAFVDRVRSTMRSL